MMGKDHKDLSSKGCDELSKVDRYVSGSIGSEEVTMMPTEKGIYSSSSSDEAIADV